MKRPEAAWTRTSFARGVRVVVALLLAAFALPSSAQDAIGGTAGGLLPPPSRDYETFRTSGADWTFPARGRREIDSLDALRRSASRTLADELGLATVGPLVLRVARNPNEMNALAPRGLPPPSYADGVAYPDLGIILLTRTGHHPENPPNLEQTLVHELAHVLLHRAVGGRPIPRWFTEGMAIHSARERSLERTRLLWEATAQRRLVPFPKLQEAFADGSHDVDVAYAEAADVVAYLFRVDDGPYKMRRLVAELRKGSEFEEALEEAYYVDLRTLEREWRADLWHRHSAFPLIVGGSGLWVVAIVFLLLAYVKRRRVAKAKLETWAVEEAATARLEAEAERRVLALASNEPPTVVPDDAGVVRGDAPPTLLDAPAGKPMLRVEEHVPTVEHDGRTYTLH